MRGTQKQLEILAAVRATGNMSAAARQLRISRQRVFHVVKAAAADVKIGGKSYDEAKESKNADGYNPDFRLRLGSSNRLGD